MTLDEAVFIVNRMAQVLSDSALILDKMAAQAGEPDDYRLTARARRQEAEALRVVIAQRTAGAAVAPLRARRRDPEDSVITKTPKLQRAALRLHRVENQISQLRTLLEQSTESGAPYEGEVLEIIDDVEHELSQTKCAIRGATR